MIWDRTVKSIQEFLRLESASGIILFFCAITAIVLANTHFNSSYNALISTSITLGLRHWSITKSITYWINEGLMTLFFLLVGLEIKAEMIHGKLNTAKKLALPGFAALGGMIVPALIYIGINWSQGELLRGWAIPTATDIAFALGVLSLLSKYIPLSLKVFLTALAIIDDLGAIIIIAIFYSQNLVYTALLAGGVCTFGLFLLNRYRVNQLLPYLLLGFALWFCIFRSGVHATVAGVILAMFIPIGEETDSESSPLTRLEEGLHPVVAYAILPLFAFFTAGFSLTGINIHELANSVLVGIALGLLVGKPLGVGGASWLAVKWQMAELPVDLNWQQIVGVSLICGIGFTMSLFIGGLAFDWIGSEHLTIYVKLGVLLGSFCSGIAGYIFLFIHSNKSQSLNH